METVQIQCGSCRRVMAVQMEHLGSQVHCPHCQAIVQAPPAPGRAADGQRDHDEIASIFAGPEVTEDLFPREPRPSAVEMPLEQATFGPDADPQESAEAHTADSDKLAAGFAEAARPRGRDARGSKSRSAEADLAALGPRRVVQGGAAAPILLIFLIPYAILATVAVIYLLLSQARSVDPLERLPDPKPKDGGPRLQERAKHDAPLPDKLKTRLGQAVRIGVLEVTPLKVDWAGGALILHLKMKNVSSAQVFNPVSQEFMKYTGDLPPYTYLDSAQRKIYGGFPEWLRGPEGKEEPFNGDIGPGQQELIRIITAPRSKDDAKRLAESRLALTWRVQVRRGFVETRGGNQVSATAVVGVEFNAQDIRKEKTGDE